MTSAHRLLGARAKQLIVSSARADWRRARARPPPERLIGAGAPNWARRRHSGALSGPRLALGGGGGRIGAPRKRADQLALTHARAYTCIYSYALIYRQTRDRALTDPARPHTMAEAFGWRASIWSRASFQIQCPSAGAAELPPLWPALRNIRNLID